MNKKQLKKHLDLLDSETVKIFNELTDNLSITSYNLNLMEEQVNIIEQEFLKTIEVLTKKTTIENRNSKILLVFALLLDLFLTISSIATLIINPTLSMILILLGIGLSGSMVLKLKNDIKRGKESLEGDTKFLYALHNTINNCRTFIFKHKQKELNRKNIQKQVPTLVNYNYAEEIIESYIYEPKSVDVHEIPRDVVDLIIMILKEELNTSESNLVNLLFMAREARLKEPFGKDKTKEILVLSRKNKKFDNPML